MPYGMLNLPLHGEHAAGYENDWSGKKFVGLL